MPGQARGSPARAVYRAERRWWSCRQSACHWLSILDRRLPSPESSLYAGGVSRVLRVAAVALVVYAGLIGLTVAGFAKVPPNLSGTEKAE